MNSENKISLAGILIGVGVFLLPFVVSRNMFYGAVNAKFFLISGLVCMLLVVWAWCLYSKKITLNSPKRSWFLYSVALVLLVHYISALGGVFFERSFFSDIIRSDGLFFLTLIFLLVITTRELLNVRDWNFIRKSAIISGGLFAVLTYFGPGGFGFLGRLFTLNFAISGLTFANDTFAGSYLLLTAILTICEFVKTSVGYKNKIFYGTIFLAHLFSPVFFSLKSLFGGGLMTNPSTLVGSARASSATLFLVVINLLGIIFLSWIFKDGLRKKAQFIWIGLWIIVFFAVTITLLIPGSFIQKFYLNESSEARLLVWEKSIDAIKEKPVLGWGPENFQFAFQKHFDNGLYLERGGREIWFDRAHNFVIDYLVEIGILGLVSILIMLGLFLRVLSKAKRLNIVSGPEQYLLSLLVFAHIFQLQTAFDTVSTYFIIGIVIGYGAWLEKRTISDQVSRNARYVVLNQRLVSSALVVVIIVVLSGILFVIIPEYSRQIALVDIFRTTNSKKQTELMKKTMSRVSDFETLRLSSGSFIKGGLAQVSESKNDPRVAGLVLSQLMEYESYFDKYLEKMPTDYRARMNYAYVLLTETTLGKNKITEAKKIISDSYELSPNNPLTYALDATSALYSGNLKLAKIKMNEMLTLNPEADFSKKIIEYIESQEKHLPVVNALKLENL